MPDQKPLLKKKVLIAPLIDLAGINHELPVKIQGEWSRFLEGDEYIRLITLKPSLTTDIKDDSSYYGIIIDHEQLKKAEEMGINVLVSTVLHPFEINIKKSGIWPLRKYTKIIDISVTVNALDVNSGALILSINDSKKIKSDEQVEPDAKKEWEADYNIVEDKVIPMIKGFSSFIKEKLIQYPWQGRIHITDDKKIRFKGGRDIGVAEGNIFEVFGKGESIQSLTGREYFVVGQKVGEISLTKVANDYSECAPLHDGQFEDGQFVRIKR
jgi:hypothetical protein